MGTVAVAPANAHCANPGTQQSPAGQQSHSQAESSAGGSPAWGQTDWQIHPPDSALFN